MHLTVDGIFDLTEYSSVNLEKLPMQARGTVSDWQGEKKVWVIGAENGEDECVGRFTVMDGIFQLKDFAKVSCP